MPRRLRPEEEALWRRVTAQAAPLHPERPQPRPPQLTSPVLPRPRAEAPTSLASFRLGETARPARPPHTAPAPQLRIDRRTHKDLSRGRRTPEATIDLHGMTLAQAHPALTRFVLASFATGRRLVLVVTGKGREGEAAWHSHKGILRRHVPEWLAAPPLGTVVQEVLPAHRSHGGAGAYYVVLRRN